MNYYKKAQYDWLDGLRGLHPVDRIVLTYLVRRAGPTGTCYPNVMRIAKDCEISKTSAFRAVRRLLEWNLIGRQQRQDNPRKREFVLKMHRGRDEKKVKHTTVALEECHGGTGVVPGWASPLKVQSEGSNEGSIAASPQLIPNSESVGDEEQGGLLFTSQESEYYLQKLKAKGPLMKSADVLAFHTKPKTLDEILKKACPTQGEPPTSPRAQGLWKDLHALYYPDMFCQRMTKQQTGQLVQALKKLEDGGLFAAMALADAVKNWAGFGKFVKAQGLVSDYPEFPHLGFFLKHHGLIQQWEDKLVMGDAAKADDIPQTFVPGQF